VTVQELRRYRLILEYDGSTYRGWQIQDEGATLQGKIESVLRELTGERRAVVGAGRTDAGVHALGQVAAADVPSRWSAGELRQAMNALLPEDIWVREIRRVPPDFHPRYDASSRSYEYKLGVRPGAASPFLRRWCWDASAYSVDPALLTAAAAAVPGERSFKSFAKTGQPERGTRCRVDRAAWVPWGRVGYKFLITADRYLHHMVRYLVGTMVDVARGRRPLEDMEALLTGPAATSGSTTSAPAPARGLYLTAVDYPPERVGDDPDRDPNPTSSLGKDDPHE
jgi:tRNA pseudouridine38-40 synthase